MRRIIFLLAMLLSIYGVAAAQEGSGQLCVRSFEDRNANSRLDAGEPLITRGIGINLLDADGVTIASALLDNSPTAAQGVVCFQFLAAGQYSVVVTSADYDATTPSTITTTVGDTNLPTVVEFGGQRAGAEAVPNTQPDTSSVIPDDQGTRILVSALATAVVLLGMIVLGVIVYLVAFRARPGRAPVTMDPRRTTGSIPAVPARETSETRKVQ
jgi:hypothetical protein